jgi:hypothetical protein
MRKLFSETSEFGAGMLAPASSIFGGSHGGQAFQLSLVATAPENTNRSMVGLGVGRHGERLIPRAASSPLTNGSKAREERSLMISMMCRFESVTAHHI